MWANSLEPWYYVHFLTNVWNLLMLLRFWCIILCTWIFFFSSLFVCTSPDQNRSLVCAGIWSRAGSSCKWLVISIHLNILWFRILCPLIHSIMKPLVFCSTWNLTISGNWGVGDIFFSYPLRFFIYNKILNYEIMIVISSTSPCRI